MYVYGKYLRISTTPTARGRKPRYPRSISPRTVWKTQPHPGDGIREIPGRYRPARCGKPSPTARLLIGWGLEIKPALTTPGRTRFSFPGCSNCRCTENASIHQQLEQPGKKTEIPPVDIVPHGVEFQPHRPIADWLGLKKKPAPPGGDKLPFLYRKSLCMSATPTGRDVN